MVRLNRSMMERYEIADRRPHTLRAALFGLDPMMLCAAARLLDRANELGGDFGAVCITGGREAEQLRAQDGMFTLLIRGEKDDGSPIREERVVQSIVDVANPEEGARFASLPEVDLFFVNAMLSPEEYAEEIAVLTHFLRLRWKAGLSTPRVFLMDALPSPVSVPHLCANIRKFGDLFADDGFAAWLTDVSTQSLLVDSLFGELSDTDFAKAQREMNYQDRFLFWAEPQLRCVVESDLPEELAAVCETEDFLIARDRKAWVFDSLMSICAAVGFLSGMDTFAQALRDERLRDFIGHAFFDELMPLLPWPREEITPYVISSFARLENSMNDVSLLHPYLMANFGRTLLPLIRLYAKREFEAPPRLSLAFSAMIMIYAGARRNDSGEYEILRGKDSFILRDDSEFLEAFSLLAHDMPAESLAYAVLADRDLWRDDLREIDGLELRLSLDLASIQRIGFLETLRRFEVN